MIKKIFVKMRSDEKEWKVVGNGKVLWHLREDFFSKYALTTPFVKL